MGIERLQQPESDEEMEADARALLQRVKAQQKAGNVQEAIIEIAQSTDLNVTAVWRGEIVSLQAELHEAQAQKLKHQAVAMAGEGKFSAALDVLQRIVSNYSSTKVAS